MSIGTKKTLNRIINDALWMLRIAIYIAMLWSGIRLFGMLTMKCSTGLIVVLLFFLVLPIMVGFTILLSSFKWFSNHILHTYHGCQCVGCGQTRPESDPHHQWQNCRCKVCGRIRDEQHLWNPTGCVCSVCGKTAHEWETIWETSAMEECCNAPGYECTHCNNCTQGPISSSGHGEYRCTKCGEGRTE